MQKATVLPANSILFLEDVQGGETAIPDFERIHLQAWATPTCVCFAVRPEPDGPTDVTIGARAEVDPGQTPKFIGIIATPSKRIHVVEVGDEVVFELPVAGTMTKVSIWFSHPKWPEQVIVGLE